MKTAIRDDNPVIFIENELLYGVSGEVPEEEFTIPMGEGAVRAEGGDVTLIAFSRINHMLLEGIPEFQKEGISVELIDPRTVKPLDLDIIARSVSKTHRVVIVEEGHRFAGVGAQVADEIYQRCFDDLDAPIERVTHAENPLPYAKHLEAVSLPSVAETIRAAKAVLYRA